MAVFLWLSKMQHEKLLRDLIKTKSLSGEEAQLRNFIADWFTNRGIESFVQDENLIIHFEGSDRSRAFIFNSHMDTVIAGETWTKNPWEATIIGDKLIGLGSSDMKSGMAASMLTAVDLRKSFKPPVDVWFTYVVNEEEDGSGSESFANWFEKEGHTRRYKDMAAIFTEPSSLTEVEHGHRGNFFLVAEATGYSGHASRPDKIDSELALDKMLRFSKEFQKAVHKWNIEFPNKFFDPAVSLGEMTSIIANAKAVKSIDSDGREVLSVTQGSVNKYPETLIATFDFRTTPETHNLFYDKVQKIARKVGVTVENKFAPSPAGFTDPKEKIVKIASTTGGKRKLVVSQASADMGFLIAKGIKSIILGPGERDQCHQPNEFCYPAQIPQAVEIYKQIIEAWAK